MSNVGTREETTLKVHGLPSPATRWSVQCLNCDAPLHGAFCSHCGQRAAPPHPTIREIAGDALSELSGWDGKVAGTFRLLMRTPGELTRRWIDGKRASFMPPLRLYLMASVVYFVVGATAPNLKPANPGNIDLGYLKIDATTGGQGAGLSGQPNGAAGAVTPLTGAERDSALADIANAPAIFRPMLVRAIDEPQAFTKAIQKAMPNVFLGLIPVLGVILAVFYRRRHYPEHLFFAMHLATFIFIALTLAQLASFTRSAVLTGVVQAIVFLWILAYGVIALRRVYGGSVFTTVLKGAGIGLLYSLAATPVILAVALWAAS